MLLLSVYCWFRGTPGQRSRMGSGRERLPQQGHLGCPTGTLPLNCRASNELDVCMCAAVRLGRSCLVLFFCGFVKMHLFLQDKRQLTSSSLSRSRSRQRQPMGYFHTSVKHDCTPQFVTFLPLFQNYCHCLTCTQGLPPPTRLWRNSSLHAAHGKYVRLVRLSACSVRRCRT